MAHRDRIDLSFRLTTSAVVAGITLTALVACSSTWERYSTSPEPQSPADVHRPIDAYMFSSDEILSLVDEREAEINDCLSTNGVPVVFSYPERDELRAFLQANIDDRVTRADGWGFFDPDSAARLGYQRAQQVPDLHVAALPEGAPASCSALLSSEDDPILRFSYASLPGGGPEQAAADERVIKAIEGWSACMADAGYNYASPLDPLQEYVAQVAPSEEQKATALTDLRCKSETNLIAAVLDVQQELDDAYIADRSGELGSIATL